MIKNKKINSEAVEKQMIDQMMGLLKHIYSNKSSDEYKSHGDITKVSEYSSIEKMITDLNILKGFSKVDATDMKNLFNTLHRPIFSKLVTEYIAEPNERNTIFTAVYTVGYRVLVGELARIYSCTNATDEGIEYKPDKISKRETMIPFIRSYNTSLEKRIDDYIRKSFRESARNGGPVQEGVSDVAVSAYKFTVRHASRFLDKYVIGGIKAFFGGIKNINPITMINTFLTAAYERKVAKFEEVSMMYLATKEAFNDYLKIPDAQRNKKVESKYQKNIDKYNIKMQNLWATIQHYDQRADVEAEPNDDIPDDDTQKEDNNHTDSSSGDPSGNEDFSF